MSKYRKKPVVIEAIQFNKGVTPDMIREALGCNPVTPEMPRFYIDTLEGRMEVTLGDWIIKGINGEFYPCKPDIFEKTYEPID
ncbi:hypothetical protein [Paenibacillus sp. OSY-SE]|uniref:hypothetical protein n=1 Tax=Paenibacillus sp. OSY-SE TaxID=1196323 RepID=UPI0003025C3F|nr:hypothetical protein [Paenibacillus sp. OSY-SE]